MDEKQVLEWLTELSYTAKHYEDVKNSLGDFKVISSFDIHKYSIGCDISIQLSKGMLQEIIKNIDFTIKKYTYKDNDYILYFEYNDVVFYAFYKIGEFEDGN